MSNIAIEVRNISKNFKLPHEKTTSVKSVFTAAVRKKHVYQIEAQRALRDISFKVKQGEFFGIVGRNGSGKSTLLKILAGIYQPTKGNVYTFGKLVPFIELGVGFNPELTGRENVYLNGAMLGFTVKEVDAMYNDIVEFAELERFMDQKLKNYSSGMQVRLAFSMATRSKADILLVDEVLAVGDANFQRKCFEYFKSLKRNKKTVVFVSHDMSAVREYCDRAILIEDSKLLMEGDASKIADAYTKMFLEEAKLAEEENKEEAPKRWGDGKIQYSKIKVEPKVLSDEDSKLTISLKVKANEKLSQLVFGIMIKNAAGEPVLGTNTKIKKQLISLNPADNKTIRWTIPNIFADGTHYIEPAIVRNNGSHISDWWQEAATFRVVREEHTPYIVNPPIEVHISEENDNT